MIRARVEVRTLWPERVANRRSVSLDSRSICPAYVSGNTCPAMYFRARARSAYQVLVLIRIAKNTT
ncbi:MAG: hypothetical protein ACJA07_001235 [Rhodococcus sp. (in: high G+C Gram-positive bacteria)]|jgi:hypothetical protein